MGKARGLLKKQIMKNKNNDNKTDLSTPDNPFGSLLNMEHKSKS
jgi:hypothetical protein